MKLYVKYTESYLIEFMTSFNNLAHLVNYLIQIKKDCNILIIMNLSTLEKKISVQQMWKYHIQKIIYIITNIFLSLKCFSMHHICKYFSSAEEITNYLMKYQILKIQMIHTWWKDFLNVKKQAKKAKKYILEICFIFIEFYFFIILFFIFIICFFTLYFFRCIIILIAVRKNDIYLIQIKYCLSHFQFFFWHMFEWYFY